MKKLLLLLLIPLVFCRCEKENDTIEPIQIASEVQNVTIHGGHDGAINLTITGGKEPFSYLWSNSSTIKDQTNLIAGTYSVTVTGANGDTASHTTTIEEATELIVTSEVIHTTKLGLSNGSIAITVSGGIAPYSILWNTSATSSTISDLAAGCYSVTVTDANQAEIDTSFIIHDPLTLSATSAKCSTYNGSDGSIDLLVQAGVAPYTYEWSTGATTEDLEDIDAGYYTVTVTDADTISATLNVIVYETYDKTTPEAEILSSLIRLKQSGIRLEYNDKVIYVDPINTADYAADADIILITHNHDDHYKPNIIANLHKTDTKILGPDVIQSEMTTAYGASGFIKVAPNDIDTVAGIIIETVYAYDVTRTNHISPHSVGYIITINGVRVYHSGDTDRIPEMTSYNADIALIPLGQTYTFDSVNEAADAAHDVNAKVVIPIHYGMYEGKASDPWTLKELLNGEIDVVVMSTL